MSREEFHVADRRRGALEAAGLASLDALLVVQAGECVSYHRRGQVYRLAMPDGGTVYLKRDSWTFARQMLRDVFRGQRPQPLAIHELQGIALARSAGLRTPEVLAWGQRRRFGLPWRGALLIGAMDGESFLQMLKTTPRRPGAGELFRQAGLGVRRMMDAGIVWLDLMPKHVLAMRGGGVGFIDLERLTQGRSGSPEMRRRVERFQKLLIAAGANEAEMTAFHEGLGYA